MFNEYRINLGKDAKFLNLVVKEKRCYIFNIIGQRCFSLHVSTAVSRSSNGALRFFIFRQYRFDDPGDLIRLAGNSTNDPHRKK